MNMNNLADQVKGRFPKALFVIIFGLITIIFFFFFLLRIVTIEGNYVGVKESWTGGVDESPLMPRTYFLFPGFTQTVYKYDASSQVFVMNDVPGSVDRVSMGRENDAYLVQSREGQDMHISMNVRWHIDITKIVDLHKSVRQNLEEKLLRPVLLRVVKDEATQYSAIDAYSGEGLVRLQTAIQKHLQDSEGELHKRGILVENFVIEGIGLDPQYIGEIKARQVASQRVSRIQKETEAAQEDAKKAKAEAQADYEKTVVEAERDKQVGILKAEKEAQQEILAAEAAKKKQVLQAEGDKDSSVLKAQAVRAMGEAEAEAQRLRLAAYAVPGADSFVQIEVSKNMAEAFKNISGYLPSDMKINLLTENFLSSVKTLMQKN